MGRGLAATRAVTQPVLRLWERPSRRAARDWCIAEGRVFGSAERIAVVFTASRSGCWEFSIAEVGVKASFVQVSGLIQTVTQAEDISLARRLVVAVVGENRDAVGFRMPKCAMVVLDERLLLETE